MQEIAREDARNQARCFGRVARSAWPGTRGAEESTEVPTVGAYRAEMAVPTRLIPNLAMREKCLTKIGDEAGRHCGHVVGIGRIGFVADGAWCAGAAAAAGTTTQERPIEMSFASPPRTVAPRAVPHRRAPSSKGKSI